MSHLSIRRARTFLAACKHSSITGAAQSINRSQTSVTKTLHDLERDLGVELFDRSSKGVTLTAYGKALELGANQAAEAFAVAGGLIAPMLMQNSPGVMRFFQMDISDKWLDAFLATSEHQTLSGAADHLNVTAAAVSANIRKIEDSLNTTLFERLPKTMIPTTFARELIRYVKLARSHLRHACDEVASMRGIKTGRVVVGSLPLMRTLVLPRAIARLRGNYPYFDVSTMEGRYDDLITALRCGDIDFLVGALRGPVLESGLVEETLITDELSLIVRVGHPLQKKEKIDWPELLSYEWILPRTGTPTRTLFESALVGKGLECPPHFVETSSTMLLRGLLLEADQITVLSRQQIYYEEKHGLLTALPFKLPGTDRPIGITLRAKSSMAPAAKVLIEEIRSVTDEFEIRL
jgi:LysR family transcriptional regulator of gallate degradation